jgi:hypothetical protein
VATDEAGCEDILSDTQSAPNAVASSADWVSVPADWFDMDPAAVQLRSDFAEICRRAPVNEIITCLECVWSMLDRAALWVSSVQIDLAANGIDLMSRTSALLLPTIPRQMRSLGYLGRASLDHLPTAMAAARSVFEAGLRLAWIAAPEDAKDREIRTLGIYNDQVRWKNTVATEYDGMGVGGDRWRQSARKQGAFVARALDAIGGPGDLPRTAAVRAQLRELKLDRLYTGYRLASEYIHGGLSGAFDGEAVRAENNPFGDYWPNDWSLAVSMCAWGCYFVSLQASENFNLGPVRGAMLAAELMLISPGSGWRDGE